MAYTQGYADYYAGFWLCDNPYCKRTQPMAYLDWKEGWLDAEEDDHS